MSKSAITLSIPIALSGRYALQGRQCLEGLKCYVRDANACGGILVRAVGKRLPLELRVYNDGSDERAAGRWTAQLISEDRVNLLFGPYGSGLVRAAAAMANAREQVLWNHSGAAEANAGHPGSWVVNILSPASRYLCAILDLVKAVDPNLRRVALYHASTGFASEVAAGVRAWTERAALRLVIDQSCRSGADVRRLLSRLKDSRAEIILGVGRIEDDLRLARSLFEVRPPGKGGRGGCRSDWPFW